MLLVQCQLWPVYIPNVMPQDEYIMNQWFQSLSTVFQWGQLLISNLLFQPHIDVNIHKANTVTFSEVSVSFLLYFRLRMIHCTLFSPSSSSWWLRTYLETGPSAGGQRIFLDRNSSSELLASDPWCVLGVLLLLLLSEQVLTDGQVNAQRLTVTFPRV